VAVGQWDREFQQGPGLMKDCSVSQVCVDQEKQLESTHNYGMIIFNVRTLCLFTKFVGKYKHNPGQMWRESSSLAKASTKPVAKIHCSRPENSTHLLLAVLIPMATTKSQAKDKWLHGSSHW
jgi:hypothetical protein